MHCQDFLTSAYLLTSKDRFYSRSDIGQLCAYMGDALGDVVLPTPVLLAPAELWTGKQVFSMLIRPNPQTRCSPDSSPAPRCARPFDPRLGKPVNTNARMFVHSNCSYSCFAANQRYAQHLLQLAHGRLMFLQCGPPTPVLALRVFVSLETQEKIYKKDEHMCPMDGFVCLRNSDLVCGRLGKATLGGGNKAGLFQVRSGLLPV